MEEFLKWVEQTANDKILVGQNASFDRDILNESFKRAGIDFRFHFRIVELHSVAYTDHLKRRVHPERQGGFSSLNLDSVLKYVGIPKEPRPHNALTGAKVEAEALSRILFGKKLLIDFEEFEVPEKFTK